MRIVSLDSIKSILPSIDLFSEIESGFAAYSSGSVVVPPVGELSFQSPPGDKNYRQQAVFWDLHPHYSLLELEQLRAHQLQ